MQDFANICLLFVIVGLGSFLLTKLALRSKPVNHERLELPEGSVLRLITPSGGYRSHFKSSDEDGICVSAPLHDNRYIPLRIGESVVVQAPGFDGLLTFRTQVTHRDSQSHQLILALPENIRRTNRRCEIRIKSVTNQSAKLNGKGAQVQDLSAWGAKVRTNERISAGDMIELELNTEFGTTRGYALESRTAAFEGNLGREIRIRFEEPLAGLLVPRGIHFRR